MPHNVQSRPPIRFSHEDLKTTERLERVLQQFVRHLQSMETEVKTTAAAATAAMAIGGGGVAGGNGGNGGGGGGGAPPVPFPVTGVFIEDTHANRAVLYPPTTKGQPYWETDRKVVYLTVESGGGGLSWQYSVGTYKAPIAGRPTDLGANDAGFRFIASDTEQHYRWDGAAWLDEIQTAYTLLRWGGIDASYPSLKRSAVNLQARLADDSAFTDVEVQDELFGPSWNGSLEVPTKNALWAALSASSSVIVQGTYTPVLTNVANLTSSSVVAPFNYTRLGEMVLVSGVVMWQPTASPGDTRLRISLPIVSDLVFTQDLVGTAASSAGPHQSAAVEPEVAADEALLHANAVDAANRSMWMQFTYRVTEATVGEGGVLGADELGEFILGGV